MRAGGGKHSSRRVTRRKENSISISSSGDTVDWFEFLLPVDMVRECRSTSLIALTSVMLHAEELQRGGVTILPHLLYINHFKAVQQQK